MVTGLSLGGLLSLMLAANEHVEGVAVLAAPFYLENPSLPYSHILRYVAPIVFKSDRAQDPYDQFVRATQQRRGEDAIGRVAYFQFPSAALSELLKIAEALRPLLSQITAPTQLIYSTGDRTVPYGNLAVIKARLTSVTQLETITLNKSDHVLTLDQEHEAVIGHIGTFFEGLAVQQ
jgi:carboxylesterase